MGSSPNTAQHSNSPFQYGIENAQEEMQRYGDNCSKLSKLISKHRYSLDGHRNITENAWKTIMQTNDALEKAGKLVEKYKSRTIIRILNDGFGIKLSPEDKKYEKLKREMEENDGKVERLCQQINGIIASQPELVGGLYMKKTIPFTEPYDEGLCEF
ncbi:hypothetical protein CEP54_010307 [Fusarium duplospermum]|uniref:Uncharacterized protein n=1 Tax=Fusarium duplospermum TaxID=1325734 RepID=A0A428PKI4_9HYPO|nr:hypothetical protein CEP54_010307 [Fusarium duplospermum]